MEALDDLGTGGAEADHGAAAGHVVEAGRGLQEGAGGAGVDVEDAGADLDRLGTRGEVAHQRRGVEAVRLGDDDRPGRLEPLEVAGHVGRLQVPDDPARVDALALDLAVWTDRQEARPELPAAVLAVGERRRAEQPPVVLDEPVGRSVRGDDGKLVWDPELVKDARGGEHDGQVRVGAHDNTHERVLAGEAGPGRLRCGCVEIGLGNWTGRERLKENA